MNFLKKIETKKWQLIAIVLICILASGFMCATATYAEPVTQDELVKFMHLTDIHYYPSYYSYRGSEDNDFTQAQANDPKLMSESGAVLRSVLSAVKKESPDYVIISGDLTSNGERQGLIDLANALRALQNEMRETNIGFQIFVVAGNHDVNNRQNAANYSSGKKVLAQSVNRKEFAQIFASLGFPDMTDEEAKDFYTEFEFYHNEHLPYERQNGQNYISSTTAKQLTIEYLYEQSNNTEDYSMGGLSYVATDLQRELSIAGFDTPLANAEEGYRTDGMFTEEILDWYESRDVQTTQVGFAHHNILPHYTMEENFTTEYISYNWEDVAERLANKGMRYHFTGHMHASDVTNYVSFQNEILYDIETSSVISYAPAIRVATISRASATPKSENLALKLQSVTEVDFTYLVDNGYIHDEYKSLIVNGKVNLPDYISNVLFTPMVDRLVNSYLSAGLRDTIKEMASSIMPSLEKTISKIVDGLIDEVNDKVLSDYTYAGNDDTLKGKDVKLFAFLNESVQNIINRKISGDHTLKELVLYAYGAHLSGGEAKNIDELPLWVKESLNRLEDGSIMNALVDELMAEPNGLYPLIKKLAKTELNIARYLTGGEKVAIEVVLKEMGIELSLTKLQLDTMKPQIEALLGMSLKGDSLTDALDVMIAGYLTDSIYTGTGGLLAEILKSFCTDATYDGVAGETIVVKIAEKDQFSYSGSKYMDYKATIENGRLPSMLTVTFGNDTSTSKNFVWFTDKKVKGTDLQYERKGPSESFTSSAITVRGTGEIYAYATPLIDLGLFSTKTVKEIGRHNVRLKGLLSNTEYIFRVGSEEEGYWSEIGTFRTAPGEGTPFDALVIADLQGMVNRSYAQAANILKQTDKILKQQAGFVLNLGDFVDDGLNWNQWGYALNTPASFWKNQTQVNVAGNHEESYFEASDYEYTPSAGVNANRYNPLTFHYDFGGMPSNQNMDQGIYYSFDYSSVHISILNTNDLSDKGLSDEQLEWLDNDLKSTDKAFKIVAMHKGIYTSGSHSYDKDVIALREQLSPIFYDNNVALVLQGHDHTYTVSYPLDGNGKPVKKKDVSKSLGNGGTVYITPGTLGEKYYDYVENELVPVAVGKKLHKPALDEPTLGIIRFDGENLSYMGYQFSLEKNKFSQIKAADLTWLWITLGIAIPVVILGGAALFIIIRKRKKENIA